MVTAKIVWVLLLASDLAVTPHGGMVRGAFVNETNCLRSAQNLNTDPHLVGHYDRWECQKIEVVK